MTASRYANVGGTAVLLDGGGGGGLPDGAVAPYIFEPSADLYDDVVADLTPWAYFRGEDSSGVLQDSSGNARHATGSTGSPTFGRTAFTSKLDSGVLLDSGERIYLPTLSTAGAFSFAGWFNLAGDASVGGDGPGLFVSRTNSGGGGSYPFFMAVNAGLDLLLSVSANNTSVGNTPFVEDGWHFLGLTSSADIGGGTSLVSIYVDGIDRGRNYRAIQNGGDWTLGRASDGYFNARVVTVSNFAMWASELTRTDMATLYAAGLEPA